MYQINDHLWEGSFYPRLPNGKRKKFKVYAETRDWCESKLAEMISEKKRRLRKRKQNKKRAPTKAPSKIVSKMAKTI